MESRMVRDIAGRSRSSGKISVRLCIGMLFLCLAVLVRYAMRDMNLNVDLLREGLMRMPGLVTENINLERTISEDLWRVHVPYLERDGAKITVRSLDITRRIKEGGEWYFFGAEGFYDNTEKTARVRGLVGTLNSVTRVWNLESPELLWLENNGEFVFPNGMTVYDDEFLLNASKASMDADGSVLLEEGGSLQWTKPLER